MRVVFDTNVVVSACFWKGSPFDCLAAWATGRLRAAISPALLTEYEDTFEELLSVYGDRLHVNWVDLLRVSGELVFPVDRASGATPDPFDEMVLECALAAQADVIVSGDKKHLLALESYQGIPILAPGEFVRHIP